MASQLEKLFHKYFPDNKRVNMDPQFNSFWMRFLRAAYYAGCLILGMTATAGLIALSMLILASVLMSVYLTAPGAAATISTIMIGLVEWGPLATILTGVLLLGPWLFNKTAWLFKLLPPDEPYNFVDVLRDTYQVVSRTLSVVLYPVVFLLTHIGAFFGWWDVPKKESKKSVDLSKACQYPEPEAQKNPHATPALLLQTGQQRDTLKDRNPHSETRVLTPKNA